jgi:multiple sugar transport system permease protein
VGRARAATAGMHAVLALCALVVIAPVAWIAIAAFKTQIALLTGQVLFQPTWANFDELLFSRSSDYLANFLNSLGVASASTFVVAVLSTLAAYSLHRLRYALGAATILLKSVVFHAAADHQAVVRDVRTTG